MPETISGHGQHRLPADADRPVERLADCSADQTPPMIPSGTTMMNAKIASFNERPSAVSRIGPIAVWYW